MTSRLMPIPSVRAEALLAVAAAFLFLLPGLAGAVGAVNPHQFMQEEGSCGRCHRQIPPRGDESDWVRDIDSMCGDCHDRSDRLLHPMEIRPRIHFDMPLPLDYEGRITCVTCHDPHAEAYSDVPHARESPLFLIRKVVFRQAYRTYFLRIPNTRGQICTRCHDGQRLGEQVRNFEVPPRLDYRGSGACGNCHPRQYEEWSRTVHARCLQNPATEPRAIRAVFDGSESIAPEQILRTIGIHWNQRYLISESGTLMMARDTWSLAEGKWSLAFAREQRWREQCAGCHYTGYNPYLDSLAEEGIGCEACHGPGGRHVDTGATEDIVNPSRLPSRDRVAVCASCHTRGHDRTGEFLYPVGYVPGADLGAFFRGLIPRKDQGADTFRDDGTLEDRNRSFDFWTERFLEEPGPECVFGMRTTPPDTGSADEERGTLGGYCRSCHEATNKGGPAGAVCRKGDVNCLRCHDPLRDRYGLPSVHDHRFVFSSHLGPL